MCCHRDQGFDRTLNERTYKGAACYVAGVRLQSSIPYIPESIDVLS
jgi:hypothetical protein